MILHELSSWLRKILEDNYANRVNPRRPRATPDAAARLPAVMIAAISLIASSAA